MAAEVEGLAMARSYAEAMISRGRDSYGSVHSPLFASALDRGTMQVFESNPGPIPGIREWDRSWRASNPMHDKELYQLLYLLSDLTGDRRYGREADAALEWFYRNAQGPKGLMAWGEHLSWDLTRERPFDPMQITDTDGFRGIHELFTRWDLLDRTWDLAPEAASRLARGLWEHQIADHERGLFSRHAHDVFDAAKKSGRTGSEFPRHGAYYIEIWAEAYRRTGDSEMLRAIEVIVNSFHERRDPQTGALPAHTGRAEYWPDQEVILATSLTAAAPRVPEPLRGRMLSVAAASDDVFLRLPHDPARRGFVVWGNPSKPGAGDPGSEAAADRRDPFSPTWAGGYGVATTASYAVTALMPRYRQTRDPRYGSLILDAAGAYLTLDVPAREESDTTTVYPIALAGVIELMLAAHEITGERRYLDQAGRFGRAAEELFFDGASPLPTATSRHEWYETLTGGDDLVLQLLRLWAQRRGDATAAAAGE